MTADHTDIARRWADGLEGDLTDLGDLLAPTARIWHSHDGVWLSRDESAARMAQRPPDAAAGPAPFGDVRVQTTATGFVVQATLRGGGRGPSPTHIVQVLTVERGKVVRVEEYIAPQSAPV